HHQPGGHVRVRWAVGRRLVPLRGPGEAAAPDRLDHAGVRPGLVPSAAPHERHLVLLCAYRPVALRTAEGVGDSVAVGRPWRLPGVADRFQRARRTHGLAALGAAVADQPAAGGARRAPGGAGARGVCRAGAARWPPETVL